MMKILVLGAGRMGLGVAYDLARSGTVGAVTVADIESGRAEAVVARIANSKVKATTVDVNNSQHVLELMRGHDAVVSCVVYRHNLSLARAAIRAKVNFCDLGGNNEVVDAELALDVEARAAGINLIPDCGLAPGMVSLLVAHGAARFERLEAIHIRVGGLPQQPKPPLNYQIAFSVEGLINEYVEPARVIRGGQIVEVASMTEIESLEFPAPYGVLEAFQTSGGTSTLPESFLGKVQELDYKTIRYPGHCQLFKFLIDLGLTSSQGISVDNVVVEPRRLLGNLLLQRLPADEPDVVLIRVQFRGLRSGRQQTLIYDIIEHFDKHAGLSAMMRTTAFPASIVAQMMASGETTSKGAIPQERCIPPNLFIRALASRGIRLRERVVDT
jgi:lysine 6-dehydrogenase